MNEKIGIITIGESPRTDVMEMVHLIAPRLEIFHTGVLDGLNASEIQALAPLSAHDYVLTSRKKDGSAVVMSRESIIPILERRIIEAEAAGCGVIWLLCTGEFPELHSKVLLIEPDKILAGFLKNLNQGQYKLGVLVPLVAQLEESKQKFSEIRKVVATYLSPYEEHTPEKLEQVKAFFLKEQCDLILLDCMGYNRKMKEYLHKATSGKVILPNQWIATMIRHFY